MKIKKYNVYMDPGHAWCKVKFSEIIKLGIQDQISNYSYARGEYLFLEEDCDMRTFVKSLEKIGIIPVWIGRHTDKQSKIRSYARYIPPVKL